MVSSYNNKDEPITQPGENGINRTRLVPDKEFTRLMIKMTTFPAYIEQTFHKNTHS